MVLDFEDLNFVKNSQGFWENLKTYDLTNNFNDLTEFLDKTIFCATN